MKLLILLILLPLVTHAVSTTGTYQGELLTNTQLRASPVPVTGSITTSGTVSVTNFPAVQAVSQNSPPWSFSLPTGAATEAKQDTGNTHLSNISGFVDGLEGFVDQLEGYLDGVEGFLSSIVTNTTGLQLQTGANTFLDKTTSGTVTLTTVNSTVELTGINGVGTIVAQITGTWVGTLQFEASVNGTDYDSIGGLPFSGTNALSTSTTGNITLRFQGAGVTKFRVRRSAGSSGTASITLVASASDSITWTVSQNANNTIVTAQPGNTANTTPWLMTLNQGGNSAVIKNSDPLYTDYAQVTRNIPFKTQSYSSSDRNVSAANSANDMCTLTGSGTKTIRVTMIGFTATQTTAGAVNIALLKRSTANSGGTSTTPAITPLDSNNGAATAVFRTYTTNPTLGTLVASVRARRLFVPTALTSPVDNFEYNFGNGINQEVVLRGTSEVLSINAAGIAGPWGGTYSCFFSWTEE